MLEITQANRSDLGKLLTWTLGIHQQENDKQLEMSERFESNLATWLESELDNLNSLLLIANYNANPVGFVLATSVINDNGFLKENLKGVIQLLWVDKEYRHKKIASELVKNAEACFKENGINYVECNYTVQNAMAGNFWRESGYLVTSITARKIIK
ncbi:GNAT family N-acetyltransferase [Aliikangiella sp. IMCC44653]